MNAMNYGAFPCLSRRFAAFTDHCLFVLTFRHGVRSTHPFALLAKAITHGSALHNIISADDISIPNHFERWKQSIVKVFGVSIFALLYKELSLPQSRRSGGGYRDDHKEQGKSKVGDRLDHHDEYGSEQWALWMFGDRFQ